MTRGLIVDLFAGGGGASTGIEAALGRRVDIGINHDPIALAVHKANHPETRHLEADIWEVRPEDATGGAPVDLLWASPDCTHFSVAKGGKPRKQGIRSLAWAVVRWAAAVRPTVICLENVAEFRGWGPLDADGRPVKARMGVTYLRWRRQLERLGYQVADRVLDASQYGAPTRRRRLFIVARRDGMPIRWPEATHGAGLLPVRTAAECIDWTLPCPSIFDRTRPLAEKTLWRIAQGIRRFVLEAPEPFIVSAGHGEREGQAPRVESIHRPLPTVTATGIQRALVTPYLSATCGNERSAEPYDARQPLRTILAGRAPHAVVAPVLATIDQQGSGCGATGADTPLPTTVTKNRHALVAAFLSLSAATLVQFNHNNKPLDLRAPLSTVTSNNHVAEVRAFLMSYYGCGIGQSARAPMRTVTTKDRLGLVTVAGADYQIVDIGMRMLEPNELLRAQFGRFAETYDLSAARTKAAKVRLIGNSVCPEVAEALVRAQFSTEAREAVA